jgi:hypothetical protein
MREVFQTMGEHVLLPTVLQADSAIVIVTDAFSCCEQIPQKAEAPRDSLFAERICPEQ